MTSYYILSAASVLCSLVRVEAHGIASALVISNTL